MGQKARETIKVDVDELITKLNKAYADEWLAYYQYLIGAKVAVGPMRGAVEGELVEHANEELEHAEILAERIIQLGGTPLLAPEDWYTETNCGYEKPEDPAVRTLVEQNIDGERCAIDVYEDLAAFVKDKDSVTYNMAIDILEDELEHEEDLEALLEDMKAIKK